MPDDIDPCPANQWGGLTGGALLDRQLAEMHNRLYGHRPFDWPYDLNFKYWRKPPPQPKPKANWWSMAAARALDGIGRELTMFAITIHPEIEQASASAMSFQKRKFHHARRKFGSYIDQNGVPRIHIGSFSDIGG